MLKSFLLVVVGLIPISFVSCMEGENSLKGRCIDSKVVEISKEAKDDVSCSRRCQQHPGESRKRF